MEQKKENVVEAEETQEVKEIEKPFAETLAMEMLSNERKKHKAKDLSLWILGGVAAISIIVGGAGYWHLTNVNLQNNREWRELFSSYDYVSQDGNGQNYYNSEIGGNVNNGATGTKTDE